MARDHTFLPDNLYDYLVSFSVREPAILRKLREETASHPMGGMQIPAEHGQFLALLMQLMGARRTLEVGVFALATALAARLTCHRRPGPGRDTGSCSPSRRTGAFSPAM